MPEYGKLIDTFLELVGIDGESKNERAVCDYVKNRLAPYSTDIYEDNAGTKTGGNCGNLFVRIKGNNPLAPVILFNAHLDVVKPGNGVVAVIDGDVIRSGGDTVLGGDDKAGLSVMLEAVALLAEKKTAHGDLLLVFTVCEEIGLQGARNLDPALLEADFGFSLDCPGPAGLIYNAAPSHDTIKAVVTGRAAHAGMEPEKGVNAIVVASRAIARMNVGRIDEETTTNVGVIRGGRATNIVPDSVTIEAEVRSHDREKLDFQLADARSALETAASEAGAKVDIAVISEYNSYLIDPDSPVVRTAREAARRINIKPEIRAAGGGSDANIFNEYGVPTVPIGTAMKNCHANNEQISRSELELVLDWVMEIIECK